MDGNTCLEYALAGERLCKVGDCEGGVQYLEAALEKGTDDLKTLSAIYSQLGNAYFYLGKYDKSLDYHKYDLTLARSMNDKLGEAKASGNLGNTLKMLGKFDEAIMCCRRHLDLSYELNDKIGEGRALYNLGNVYHAKGKHIGRLGPCEPGEFPEEVKSCLHQAVEYYKENLRLMEELNERVALGRACGNLGNTYYLLGNFYQAIKYHQKRLEIAKEFGDKPAERRACTNLGNAHVFLGEFEIAANHYNMALRLSQELKDRAVEAQAYYALGNTHMLLHDYEVAVNFHRRHYNIAVELSDREGERRASWSLWNAYSELGDEKSSIHYAQRHMEISKEINVTQHSLQTVSDLQENLNLSSASYVRDKDQSSLTSGSRRSSMEQLSLLHITPETSLRSDQIVVSSPNSSVLKPIQQGKRTEEEERFFDQLSNLQSNRLDDQRSFLADNKENRHSLKKKSAPSKVNNNGNESRTNAESESKEDLLDLIAGMQNKRLNEQRASLPNLPGFSQRQRINGNNNIASRSSIPDEDFFDMLMRCQGTRLEDQRSTLPVAPPLPTPRRAPTVPDEDLFSLILRLQNGRMDDQRSSLPVRNFPMSNHITNKTNSR